MLKVMIDTNILISGLFFSGNPRKVLIQALDDKICLILSEDVVDETERVISKKFSDSKQLPKAMALFYAIISKSEVIDREKYQEMVSVALNDLSIRDVKDAPILACALFYSPDCFITGDKDFDPLKVRVKFNILSVSDYLSG